MDESTKTASLQVSHKNGETLLAQLSGDWRAQAGLPGLELIEKETAQGEKPRRLEFDTTGLTDWNTGLLAFLTKCLDWCREQKIDFQSASLPEGVKRLMDLAEAVPEKKDAHRESIKKSFLESCGLSALAAWKDLMAMMTFMGEIILAFIKMLKGKAQFRWSDTLVTMQESGPEALGIVALINFLMGLILAFVGAIQLSQFGAAIYTADLVAIATVREMGCIMTGIILCGRTGAAFAAQLGTMKVNEEIDAFQTLGISPIEFLVLPRMLALLVMMPLLVVFADLIGIIGGFVVSMSLLDVTPAEYIDRTLESIKLKSFLLGIFKGCFFGMLVAFFGCLRGIQCGSNAAAVGLATTSAVVAGITAIIAADGIFAVICNAWGI